MTNKDLTMIGESFAKPTLHLVVSVCLALCTGCLSSSSSSDPAQVADVDVVVPDDDALCRMIDEVLDATYARRLSVEEHAAWQILHGVLAFQHDFRVEKDGEMVPAVQYLLDGGSIRGFTVERGSHGLRAIVESGTKAGQGHADQWFAVLAQCELPVTQTIRVNDETFTMGDFVAQVQWDLPRNVEQEFSWTLIGLTTYLPTSAEWESSDGKTWSIAKLVELETEKDLQSSACGGTHRLIGLAMALNRHLEQGGALEGPWKKADEVIREAAATAKRYQNADGSFSTHYFSGPGSSLDLAQNLGTTGHTLEFLTLALTEEELKEPWVTRAVMNLCELFRETQDLPLECGALYHAAHGLVLYRWRCFGPRRFGEHAGESESAEKLSRLAAERLGLVHRGSFRHDADDRFGVAGPN